jgi:hypothetical protein
MLNERALGQHVGQLGVAVLDDQPFHAMAPAGSAKVKGPRGEARAETKAIKSETFNPSTLWARPQCLWAASAAKLPP